MKKFLSMVMAAAMVVSLVPATAFAAANNAVTASIMDAQNYVKPSGNTQAVTDAELRLRTTSNFVTSTKPTDNVTTEVTLTLDNAYFADAQATANASGWVNKIAIDDGDNVYRSVMNKAGDTLVFKDGTEPLRDRVTNAPFEVAVTDTDTENGKLVEVTLEITGRIYRGWDIYFNLDSTMSKVSKGTTATVTVDSDDLDITGGDDLVYASIEAEGIKASVKDTVDVATEEVATLKDIKIETTVGDFDDFITVGGTSKDELKLKLNSGFEFVADNNTKIEGVAIKNFVDDDEIVIPLKDVAGLNVNTDTWTITGLKVDAVSAKAGSTATVKVYLTGCDTVSVEAAKVVDYTVNMTVDEDDDVPVIYSGVNVDNDGITDDSDHESLEVTIKESFAGAWNNSKDFTLSVPEGVYVAAVTDENFDNDANKASFNTTTWFEKAYEEGSYVDLTFERRTWNETNPNKKHDPAELTFKLVLVADPNFEGDVVLKLTGDAVEEQEVTIAKFVKPFVVEAQQNDMQIDYRNTEIPTSVVVKEAEAGLWDKDTRFVLALDKIELDDEGTVAVDEKSGLELKDDEVKSYGTDNKAVYFKVSSRSDDEAATVTISGLQLYMERNLPAGAYDLKVWSPEMLGKVGTLRANGTSKNDGTGYLGVGVLGADVNKSDDIAYVGNINDDFYSDTAKAGFVNIVTAGREDTDSFTTKVVVPVGESYLISGENKVEIPVPAYINAAGYTMLPLRAVAVALGINENNVLWDQSTRTATVMYGSKIINMTYGQKVVYVNGAMIPATAAVEITNDRMFLGLRDLGNALGVTDIAWDGATKTATLNGNK